MYTLGSTEFNQIIETPNNQSIKKRLVLLDNGTIIDKIKSLTLYSSSSSQELQLGTTNMAYIEAEVESDLLLTNRQVRLECGVTLSDGSEEYIPMGVFTIQKPQGDIDFVKFKAHDNMQKFEKVYSSTLDYPTTSDLVLDEICNMCGVMLSTPIENPIEITEKLQGYTCREVLGFIAGIHGKFACIDRLGTLNLRWYSEIPIDKQIGLIWAFNKSDDDFTVDKIEIAKDTETNYTSGSGFSAIYHSNPLATQEIADDLFAKLNGFTYNASTIEILDDIRLDIWDVIKVIYLDGKEYLVPCMSLKQDFGQGSTSIQSFAKTNTENEYRYTGTTTNYINRIAMELLLTNRIVATKVDAEYVNSVAITTENFEAKVAEIKDLVVEEIDGKYATIDFANIDVANINKTNIGLLFAEVGLLDRATIVDGHVTGFLDAVEINANKITAGTLIADRILLSGGENGVLYALNNLGELTSTNIDTLDGYVLTDRTITADKIIAKSITSNEIDVAQLFADEAAIRTLIAQTLFTDAIETNRIVIGASNKADEAIEKVNKTVKSITMHYLATTASSGVTTSTSGWTTTVQQIDATKKYLWTYQTIAYADNTTTDTSPVISGVYGNEGTNGVGITSVTPLYYLKSNTTAPSAPTSAITSTSTGSGVWTTAIPKYVSGYTYFTCTQTKYTDNTYSWSTVVADNSLTDAYASLENKADRDEIVAENLLEFPYFEKNHTQSDIEWTVLDDATVKANGTASALSQFYFNRDTSLELKPNTTYTLSGCPSGGSASTYGMRIIINYRLDGQVQYRDLGDGVTFTTPSNYQHCRIMVDVNAGITVDNLIFKPMLELGSVAHPYREYKKGGTGIANNLYYQGTTLIDGGNIYTDTLFSKDINITGSFVATSSAWIRPEWEDATTIFNYYTAQKWEETTGTPNPYSLTDAQKKAFDFNMNGEIDLQDCTVCKMFSIDPEKTLQDTIDRYGYEPIETDISVIIEPRNPDKVIRLTGINSFGREIDVYFGMAGINVPSVKTNRIQCTGIKAEDFIYCVEDVYANYGLDTQVSLLGLQDRINKLQPHPYTLLQAKNATTTATVYTLLYGRKFTDYGLITITIGTTQTDIRESMTAPMWLFYKPTPVGGVDTVNTFTLTSLSDDGTINRVAVKYVSDTQVAIQLLTSRTDVKMVNIYGVKTDDVAI